MKNSLPLSFLLATVLPISACFETTIPLPQACIETLVDITAASDENKIEIVIDGDDLAALPDELLSSATIRILSIEVTPVNGIDRLSEVSEASLSIGGQVIASCEREHCMNGAGALAAEAASEIDVTKYIEAGELRIQLELDAELPKRAWQANVVTCFDGEVEISF